MTGKERVFIFIVVSTLSVHLIFTHFRRIRKNNFGKEDPIRSVCNVGEKIKSDYNNVNTIGYKASDSTGMDFLSKYYQMRYRLAPVNLSMSSDADTILIYNEAVPDKNAGRPGVPGIDDKYTILAEYDNDYSLMVR